MRLRDKITWALSTVRKIVRNWNCELKEHDISLFFGWLLTGAFSFYLILVLTAHAILENANGRILPTIYMLPVWVSLVALAVVGMCVYGKSVLKRFVDGHCPAVSPWKVGVVVFLVYFAWLVVMQPCPLFDTHVQMRQVRDFRFNDWHPILHTFSLFLVTRIQDSLFSIACVQVIAFSALVAWLYKTLLQTTSGCIVGLVTLWVALNPINFTMSRILYKDVAFALSSLGVCIAVLNIIVSRGEWLKRNGNIGLLALLLFLATFYRHNGIFFTGPLCLVLAFVRMSRASRLRFFVVLVVFAVLGLSYRIVKQSDYLVSCGIIDTHYDKGQRFAESVGLLMCGMLGAYVNDYERMPEDARDFISLYCGREKILEAYRGDYNSVKGMTAINMGRNHPTKILVEHSTPKTFWGMFIRTVHAAPGLVMHPILRVTSLVWDPFRTRPPDVSITVSLLKRDLEGSGPSGGGMPTSLLKRDLYWPISVVMATPVGLVFGSVGFWMLVLVGIATVGFVYRGRTAWILSIPWLCYGFGTMCLLCGDDWRFFYALVLCAPLAVAILFIRRKSHSSAD